MAGEKQPDERFQKGERLTLAREFDQVFAARRSAAGRFLVVYAVRNDLGYNRLGLVVGRRTGSAPVRNRFKRLVREAFRLSKSDQPLGWNWVVLPRLPKKDKKAPDAAAPDWTLQEIQAELLQIARRLARVPHGESRKQSDERREGRT